MDKLAEEAVAYYQENDIPNPSEILRVIQNKFVKGRNLEVQRVDEVSEGMTQYILVNRKSVLVTTFEELKEVALTDLRKTLQVDFYGEVCKYYIQLFRYMVLDVAYAVKAYIKELLLFKVRLKWFLYSWHTVRNQAELVLNWFLFANQRYIFLICSMVFS